MRVRRVRVMKVLVSVSLALGLLGGAATAPAFAKGKHRCEVAGARHSRYPSLQAAVDHASAGDTLRVRGTCIGLTNIDKDLTIKGAPGRGWGRATLDGDFAGTVLTFGTAGPGIDASVVIRDLTITGGTTALSLNGHRENVPPLPGDPHVTVTLRDVRVADNQFGIGVSEGSVLRLTGHTRITDTDGTGIRGFLAARIVLYDHSSVDHNGDCGISGTEILPVVLNDHSSLHHNLGCGASLEAYSIVLNDRSSVYRNAGAGIYAGDEGGHVTCNDHSTIHDNVYGIKSYSDAYSGASPTHCVAGGNVYDNTAQDIYIYGF